MNDRPYTAVGVTARGIRFPGREPALWLPASHHPQYEERRARIFNAAARLPAEMSVARARAEADAIAARLAGGGAAFGNLLRLRNAARTGEDWTRCALGATPARRLIEAGRVGRRPRRGRPRAGNGRGDRGPPAGRRRRPPPPFEEPPRRIVGRSARPAPGPRALARPFWTGIYSWPKAAHLTRAPQPTYQPRRRRRQRQSRRREPSAFPQSGLGTRSIPPPTDSQTGTNG